MGAGAVRMARPHAGNPPGHVTPDAFDLQTITVTHHHAEELAAEAVGVTLATHQIGATAFAYRSEQQARAVRAAMARQQITNYELVPEVFAALEFAQATGDIRGISSLVVYDLGSTGLSVSVVDTQTREVRHSERTSDISGDYLDSLIREQQIASGRIAHPQDPAGLAALDALCREAKETAVQQYRGRVAQRAGTGAARAGELRIADHAGHRVVGTDDAGCDRALRSSGARCARDRRLRQDSADRQGARAVDGRAGHRAGEPGDGGRPRRGAARATGPPAAPVGQPSPAPNQAPVGGYHDEDLSPAWLSAPPKRRPKRPKGKPQPDDIDDIDGLADDWLAANPRRREKRELNGAVLTVSALAVVAAIGLGLGYGPQVLERDSQSSEGSTSVSPSGVPRTTTLDPQIAVAPATTTETEESLAAPPPRRQTTTTAPPTQGPNTFVVPGLPPIVVPTIPPEVFPFPPPPPQQR